MSDKPLPTPPGGNLSADQVQSVSGGSCTAQDYVTITGQLTSAYESLVDFTSHVIERLAKTN